MKFFSNHKISNWFGKRFPVSDFVKETVNEEIPGGSRFSYVLGSALLFLFIILAATGIWQMFVYVPTVAHAYDSLSYLRLNVPFGWLLHGLHYWGGNAFAVIVGLHILRVFIWGAYKRPRELVWLSGVILLILTCFFMFTGPVLPWDKKGYWACKVGLNMVGSIPGIGTFLQALFQGQETLGELTLSRMFVLHVAIIPALLMGFIVAHLIAFRAFGSVGPWKESERGRSDPFWPDQIFKDMVVGFLIFLLLVALSAYFPPPFSGMADPMDTTYVPKPEWTFEFIYQLLKYFPGEWEPVGIVGIPLLLILLFVSLPFLDRNQERNPFKRYIVMFLGALFLFFVLYFAYLGFTSEISPEAGPQGKLPPPSLVKAVHSEKELAGKNQFKSLGCTVCHSITKKGGKKTGPNLFEALSKKKNLTRDWLRVQITDPAKHDKLTLMPPYSNLSKKELNSLIDFLEKISKMTPQEADELQEQIEPSKKESVANKVKNSGLGQAVNIVGSYVNGKTLFDNYCQGCHGPEGRTNASGFHSKPGVPPLNPISKSLFSHNAQKFIDNIDPFIQHGTLRQENQVYMPNFGDSHALTQQEIADIEAYVLHINQVNRTKIISPGIQPKTYFFINLIIAIVLFFFGSIYWYFKASKPSD